MLDAVLFSHSGLNQPGGKGRDEIRIFFGSGQAGNQEPV